MVDKILRLSQIESVEKKKGSSVKWCWWEGKMEAGKGMERGREGFGKGREGEREGLCLVRNL